MTKNGANGGVGEKLRHMGWKKWLLLSADLLLALLALAAFLGWRSMAGTLASLDAADRFRGESEMRFAQEACFMPIGGGKTPDDVWQFRSTLDSKMVEESLTAPEGGSLYIDGYSGSGQVHLSVDNRTAAAEAIGVGGDFFLFHPLPLKSGSYLTEGDLMDDRILLDEMLAWRLFGSSDIAGMDILVNGIPYVVGGVVERESDFASQAAFGKDTSSIFMSYSALERFQKDLTISCYEVVLPDPISGYAHKLVEESFSTDGGVIVENTSRYSVKRLLDVMGQFGVRSMRQDKVLYPYWENAARMTEDYGALFLLLVLLFALCPAVTLLVLAVRGVMGLWRGARTGIPRRVTDMVERRREAKLEKKYENDAKGE